jgi:hypothetical protein
MLICGFNEQSLSLPANVCISRWIRTDGISLHYYGLCVQVPIMPFSQTVAALRARDIMRRDCIVRYCQPYCCTENILTRICEIIKLVVPEKLQITSSYKPLFSTTNEQTPWPESANELYRPSDRSLPAKLMQTFEDKGMLRSQRSWSPTAVISVF